MNFKKLVIFDGVLVVVNIALGIYNHNYLSFLNFAVALFICGLVGIAWTEEKRHQSYMATVRRINEELDAAIAKERAEVVAKLKTNTKKPVKKVPRVKP